VLLTAALAEAPTSIQISSLSWPLKILPVPAITAVIPPTIYNLASVTSLEVRGSDFLRTGEDLLCVFFRSTGQVLWETEATFVSAVELSCPFKLPPIRADTVSLKITNDGGDVYSETSFTISISASLPRITGLSSPRLLFTGESVDLTLSGTSLGSMGTIVLLQFTYGDDTVEKNCTVATASTSMECYEVVFPSCGGSDSCTFEISA